MTNCSLGLRKHRENQAFEPRVPRAPRHPGCEFSVQSTVAVLLMTQTLTRVQSQAELMKGRVLSGSDLHFFSHVTRTLISTDKHKALQNLTGIKQRIFLAPPKHALHRCYQNSSHRHAWD